MYKRKKDKELKKQRKFPKGFINGKAASFGDCYGCGERYVNVFNLPCGHLRKYCFQCKSFEFKELKGQLCERCREEVTDARVILFTLPQNI